MFPGNNLILSAPGVIVAATEQGKADLCQCIEAEMHWMDHGPQAVERHITAYYNSDPVVMKLLELYMDKVYPAYPHDDNESDNDEEIDLTGMKRWQG